MDITSFDRKFKESPWRSRTSGNLSEFPWRSTSRGGHGSGVPDSTTANSAFFIRGQSKQFMKNRIRSHLSMSAEQQESAWSYSLHVFS